MKFLPLALVVVAALVFTGDANAQSQQLLCPDGACSLVAVDNVNPSDKFIRSGNSYTFEHNIIGDNGFKLGDQVLSGSLDIWFSDDWLNDGLFGQFETAKIDFDTQSMSQQWYWADNIWNINVDPANLQDGKLSVTISSTQGDFYFEKSQLTANFCPSTVPEPATLTLLGSGLFGLLGFSRRRA